MISLSYSGSIMGRREVSLLSHGRKCQAKLLAAQPSILSRPQGGEVLFEP